MLFNNHTDALTAYRFLVGKSLKVRELGNISEFDLNVLCNLGATVKDWLDARCENQIDSNARAKKAAGREQKTDDV